MDTVVGSPCREEIASMNLSSHYLDLGVSRRMNFNVVLEWWYSEYGVPKLTKENTRTTPLFR